MSEKIEIFVLLPSGRLVARRIEMVVFHEVREAARFSSCERQVVVDEEVAKFAAKQRLPFEQIERDSKGVWKLRPVGAVGIGIRRTRIARVVDAIEAGNDLRCDIKIRVGGR